MKKQADSSHPISPSASSGRSGLNQLPSGTRVTVCHVASDANGMARLMAMGVCVGRQIEVVRQGNPLIVRLLGARIGISGRLAEGIIVERSPL